MKIPVTSRLQSISSQSVSAAGVKAIKPNAGTEKAKDLRKIVQEKMKEQMELKKELAERQKSSGSFESFSSYLFGDDRGASDVKEVSRTKVRRFPPG